MTLYEKYNLRNRVPYEKYVSESKNEDKYNPIKQQPLLQKPHMYHEVSKNKQSNLSRTNALAVNRNPQIQAKSADELLTSKHKTPKRISQLAQPRKRSSNDDLSKKDILSLSSLIIYETSPRLLDLAKPRRIVERISKESNGIPKRVLKAKPTNHIIQLSKPRQLGKMEDSNGKKNIHRSLRSKISQFSHPTNYSIQNSNKKKKKKNQETDSCLLWNKEKDKKVIKEDVYSSNSDVSMINIRIKNKKPKNLKLRKKSAIEIKKI